MNKRITESITKGKAFIPFITCGDPSLEVTEQLVYAMEEAGADLIELGIPFSDRTAEGPVIQAANIRALSGGVTTDKVFEMVEKIRKNSSIPMVFMTYANVVFSYGTERFVKKAAEVGMDGLILPDVPFEEKEEFDGVCKEYGLDLISLIAPTSHERISMISNEAQGFVYCVSSLGVTGMRSQITTDIGAMVELVKKDGKTYVVINDYEKVRELFGELLAEIQRIKSTGDYDAAREQVESYAVKVDPELHAEVLERYKKLNLAPYKGFVNPKYEAVTDADGNITDVKVTYDEGYTEQMLRYSKDYSVLPSVND